MHIYQKNNLLFRLQPLIHWIKGWIYALLPILYLLTTNYAKASSDSIRHNRTGYFIHLSKQDGLAADKVLDILQDKYGFIWLATLNGLSRYDGNRFINYLHHESDINSITDNTVTALTEDSQGNLWIGTRNGLNRYDRTTDKFIRYTTANGLKNNYIKALYADQEENIWMETAEGYLTRYSIYKDQWTHTKHNPGVSEGEHYYWHIYEDSLKNLWIGGRTLHGIRYNKESHEMTSVPTWSEKGMPLESAFFVQDTEGNIYSSSIGSLQRFDTTLQKFIHCHTIPFEATCAVTDSEGNIWIGGYGGLIRWEYPKSKTELFLPDNNNIHSISSNEILCMYASSDGCIWIGTENGVNIYSPLLNLFETHRGYHVSALMEDSEKQLWVGTSNDGVYVFDKNQEPVSHFNYRLMTKDIDYPTFIREKETIRQYIRHEAIYSTPPLSENLSENYKAYKNADLHFRYPDENHVSSLYQDKAGMIYVGLWNHVGFNKYNPHTGQWKRYALWSKKPDYHYPRLWLGNPFGANWYNGFLEDRKGRFWCATWEAFGLNLFNREKGTFEFKHYFPNNVPCFPQGKIEQIIYDKVRNQYILMGANTYFGYYDNKEKRFYKFGEHFPSNYTNLEIVKGYYQYSKAKIFTMPNGFGCEYILSDGKDHLYMANTKKIMYMNLADHSVHPVFSMPSNSTFVWTLSSDKKNIIVCYDKGVCSINLTNQKCTPFRIHQATKYLKDEKIRTILESQDKELWIGTSRSLWRTDKQDKWSKVPIESQTINVIRISHNGDLYAGGTKGLYIINKDGKIFHLPFLSNDNNGIPGSEIRDIYTTSTPVVWIATNDGLVKLSDNTIRVFNHQPSNPQSIINNNIYTISEGPEHKLWIATFLGLCLFDPIKETSTDMTLPGNDCLTSRLASCITEDKEGNIWVGTTEKGLNVLSIKTDTIAHHFQQAWNPNSLPDNYVECIYCSTNGEIWVGTHRGLAKYLPTQKQFACFKSTEHLQIKGITEDSQRLLWLTTNKGLVACDSKGNILRCFHDYHGLPDNELSKAICKLKNGKLCIGSSYGFSLFNPQLLVRQIAPKKIFLTNIQINDSVIQSDLNLNESKILNLQSDQNSLSFGFSSTDYEHGKHLTYRYKLTPFEDKWNYTTPPFLTARYTNLSFGTYCLEIEVTNAFGEWNGKPFKIYIDIATPWYYSWWFISLLSVCLIATVWGIIRFREKRLRKENERLESLIKDRTEELYLIMENKNKFFNIVSHDLKGPLNHLNILSDNLIEEYEDLDDSEKIHKIRMINKASHQGKTLIDNLQLWVLSQKEIIRPVFKQTNLTDEIKAVLQLLSLNIQQKELSITVPSIPIMVYTDKNMLSTILRNLIANAIKYSYRKGNIRIITKETKEYWNVSIEDDGIGIPPERIEKLFQIGTKVSSLGTEKEEGTGLGLLIVKEFINRLDETIQVNSIKEKGSIFTFTLHKTFR